MGLVGIYTFAGGCWALINPLDGTKGLWMQIVYIETQDSSHPRWMLLNLLEAEGKRLFSEYAIPVPEGRLMSEPDSLEWITYPVVVKAQVPIGGRGKAGGIRVASTRLEAERAVKDILGMTIKGYRVEQVLVERKIDAQMELYLSIVVDRSKRRPIIMASRMGGVDIESVPDDKIERRWVDPWIGLQPFIARDLFFALGLNPSIMPRFQSLLLSLWRLYQATDAELVEINPLALTPDGMLIAVDAKVVIDDDALFRQERFQRVAGDITPLERKARDRGIAFVQLEGDIGIIANGAGLTMATLDFLTMHGGRGGVFLDLGGTDDPQKVKEALLLMAEARQKVILINIFGGITKCDTVATGLIQALKEGRIETPIVARIKGVNEKEAFQMLKDTNIRPALSLEEATAMAVEIARGG
jgi:succinyl-CoA synthetase beta subunit